MRRRLASLCAILVAAAPALGTTYSQTAGSRSLSALCFSTITDTQIADINIAGPPPAPASDTHSDSGIELGTIPTKSVAANIAQIYGNPQILAQTSASGTPKQSISFADSSFTVSLRSDASASAVTNSNALSEGRVQTDDIVTTSFTVPTHTSLALSALLTSVATGAGDLGSYTDTITLFADNSVLYSKSFNATLLDQIGNSEDIDFIADAFPGVTYRLKSEVGSFIDRSAHFATVGTGASQTITSDYTLTATAIATPIPEPATVSLLILSTTLFLRRPRTTKPII